MKITNEVKQIIYTEETHNLDYVMTCINRIPSPLNTLTISFLQKHLHYSYIKTKYNNKEKIINNNLITYVEALLNDINHYALIQEWKLILDATAYQEEIYALSDLS